MRTLIFCINLFIFGTQLSRGAEAEERTYFGALYHYLDKLRNPVGYITDNESVVLCKIVTGYNPENSNPTEFTLDEKCKENIHRVFDRQRALLLCVEKSICQTPDPAAIERIMHAMEKEEAFFSPCVKAVLSGSTEQQITSNQELLKKLRSHSASDKKSQDAVPVLNEEKSENKSEQATEKFISLKALETIVMADNPGVMDKLFNFIRKTVVDPIRYLTDDKSFTVCNAVLHFNPKHPYHHPDWHLNPQLPFHKTVIRNAFEREYRLIDNLEDAIIARNNESVVMKLTPQTVPEGYFSPVLKSVIAAYLTRAHDLRNKDTQARKEHQSKDEQMRKEKADRETQARKEEFEKKTQEQKAILEARLKAKAEHLRQVEINAIIPLPTTTYMSTPVDLAPAGNSDTYRELSPATISYLEKASTGRKQKSKRANELQHTTEGKIEQDDETH